MKKIFYLFAVCLLSSCSIMVDTEDLTGLSISSWDSVTLDGIEVSGDFKIQKIDGEVYFTYIASDVMLNTINTLKLTYDGTGIVPEEKFTASFNSNIEIVSVLSINGNFATMRKYYDEDTVNIYLHCTSVSGKPFYKDIFVDYAVYEYINTWTGADGLAYISAVVDYTKIIVGRFDAYNKWNVLSTYDTGGRVLDLNVQMGQSYPYATWRTTANKLTLAAFDYTSSSRASWTTLATMNSIKSAQLSVEKYTNVFTGILSEDVYVGAIGAAYNEFQLYKLNSYKQLGRTGEYILNISGDYNFANHKGLILFSHLSDHMDTPLTFNSISEKWGNSASIYNSIKGVDLKKMQAMSFDDVVALILIEDGKLTIKVGK